MEQHVLLQSSELVQRGDVLAEWLELEVRWGEGSHEVVLNDGVKEMAKIVAPARKEQLDAQGVDELRVRSRKRNTFCAFSTST